MCALTGNAVSSRVFIAMEVVVGCGSVIRKSVLFSRPLMLIARVRPVASVMSGVTIPRYAGALWIGRSAFRRGPGALRLTTLLSIVRFMMGLPLIRIARPAGCGHLLACLFL